MKGFSAVDKMLLEHDCDVEWRSLGPKCQKDYSAVCPAGHGMSLDVG